MHQVSLDKENNSAKIDLNAFFYPLNLVQWAASEFREHAEFSIEKAGPRVIVGLKPRGKGNAEEIALHYCNFVLGLRREFGQHA